MSSAPDAIDASASGKYQGSIVTIVLVGVAAGFLSGLFGVGGGILIVPGLVLVAKMDQRIAHGTSWAAVLPISASSLLSYWAHDHVDWRVGACLAVGAHADAARADDVAAAQRDEPGRVACVAVDGAQPVMRIRESVGIRDQRGVLRDADIVDERRDGAGVLEMRRAQDETRGLQSVRVDRPHTLRWSFL